MDKTDLRDFDEPMHPRAWRSWKAWAGYNEPDQENDARFSVMPIAFAIWLLLGGVALMVWMRTH